MMKLFYLTVIWLLVYLYHKTHNTTIFFWKNIHFNFGQHGSLLSHQHLLSRSQKNTIISLSRLKKNCWLLYFLCIATSSPFPKCATGHIVSLENFDSNVYRGTMFRKKNSPKQIALGEGAKSNTHGLSWEQLLWSSIGFESWGTGH